MASGNGCKLGLRKEERKAAAVWYTQVRRQEKKMGAGGLFLAVSGRGTALCSGREEEETAKGEGRARWAARADRPLG